MADWVFWPHFSQMGPPRPHTPLTYKTEGMRAVRGQNTARIQICATRTLGHWLMLLS